MLVIGRKVGQNIKIGENIKITVVKNENGTVKLGIDAPKDLTIIREELESKQGEVFHV